MLYLNTYEPEASTIAREKQLGLELNEYLWPMTAEQLQQAHASARQMIRGIDRLVMHGTIPSPDLEVLASLGLAEVKRIYEQACAHAKLHGISRMVFHSGFVSGRHDPAQWIDQSVAFWRTFLTDKPANLIIYVENMVDDDPSLLASLCDEVADSRLKLCLDVGHAHCNSSYPVWAWIGTLGERIGHVHLHNNDGQRDRHWALGRGSLDMDAVMTKLMERVPRTTYSLECDFGPSLQWLVERGYLV